MLDQRREKLLLAAVLALLGALVLDRLVTWPVRSYVAGVNRQIDELNDKIAEAERLDRARPEVERQFRTIQRRIRPDTEQAQNEFRRFLEAQAGRGVEVKRVRPVSVTAMQELPDLKLISCELDLVAPVDRLRAVLENLDASRQLLRIDKVQIANTTLDDPRLTMQITVSTIARAEQRRAGTAEGRFADLGS